MNSTREDVVEEGRAANSMRTVLGFSLAVLATGAMLRFHVAVANGLWRDEAQFLLIGNLPTWSAVVEFLRAHESHPPLFYLIVRGWSSLGASSDRSLEVLPVAFGIGSVVAGAIATRVAAGRRAAAVCIALLSLSPAMIVQSSSIRPYSLLVALLLAGFYGLQCAARDAS